MQGNAGEDHKNKEEAEEEEQESVRAEGSDPASPTIPPPPPTTTTTTTTASSSPSSSSADASRAASRGEQMMPLWKQRVYGVIVFAITMLLFVGGLGFTIARSFFDSSMSGPAPPSGT